MTDINVGALSEAINDKADRDLTNLTVNIDYVVDSQLPTVENNYTWYRVYKSGWVEQGGYLNSSTTDYEVRTIILPKTMSDTNYSIQITVKSSYNNSINTRGIGLYNGAITSNSFQICNQTSTTGTVGYHWEVKGMGV